MLASLQLPLSSGFTLGRPRSGHHTLLVNSSFRGVALLTATAASRFSARTSTVTTALSDPFKTLGISRSATESEIKQAHRKLVKKYHPDLRSDSSDASQAEFLRIQAAYEILTGKRRGKEIDDSPTGDKWDFHDWYWSFSMRNRKKKSSRAAAAGERVGPPPREQWRSQMQGLRAKAMAKKMQQRQKRGGAQSSTTSHSSSDINPSTAASQKIWRSATRNARTTTKAPSSAQHLNQTAQQTVWFAAPPATDQVARAASVDTSSTAAPTAARESIVAAPLPSTAPSSRNFTPSTSQPRAAAAVTTAPGATNNARSLKGLRSLLDRAAHAVHDARLRHDAALHSHISALKHHVADHLDVRGLQQIIMPSLQHFEHQQPEQQHTYGHRGFFDHHDGGSSAARNDAFHHIAGGERGAGLHVQFDASHYSGSFDEMSFSTTAAANVNAGNATVTDGDGAAAASYPTVDQHSRKFANRSAVEERLGSQMAGLRRRAAMKREL